MEGKFHPKHLEFAPWANVRIFTFEHMYGIEKALPIYLTLGEEPLKKEGCVFKVGPKKTVKMTLYSVLLPPSFFFSLSPS